MQFRCFSCGMVFSDGIPPLEALSDQQSMGLYPDDPIRNMKAATLDGTRFEGMSSASFCSFCLVWIHEFPRVTKSLFTYKQAKRDLLAITVGQHHTFDIHAATNRYMILEEARMVSPDSGMLSALEYLLFDGIRFVEKVCAYPPCKNVVNWDYSHRNYQCPEHNMLNMKQFLRNEHTIMRYHFHTQPDHRFLYPEDPKHFNCKMCADAYYDSMEAEYEAAMEEREL